MSSLSHLQRNFKVNYWVNVELFADIWISKRIYQKTNLQTKFIVECSASGPKVTTKLMFIIKFNLCITYAICAFQVSLIPRNLHHLTDCKNLFSFHWFCLLS